MKTNTASLSLSGNRGSAFITVLIFTFMLTAIIGSMLQWSLSERRLNVRNSYWLEARNGAEALAEYGASQLDTQFKSQASPPSFNPTGTNALALPAASFFAGSLIDSAAYTSSHTTGLQLVAGDAVLVPAAANALYYINGNDPNNRQDPMKNQWVYRRDVQIVASATVIPPNGGKPVTARVSQTVMVRGAPLFSHAIFYSANDLEIFPGPVMNIYGPVHCNGNIFMSSQGSNSLTFNGPVSMTGNIYHAWSNSNTAAEGTGSEALKEGAVNFLVSATTSGGTTTYTTAAMDPTNSVQGWQDSTWNGTSNLDYNKAGLSTVSALVSSTTNAAFAKAASQTWGSNLQTAAMGVGGYYPIAFKSAVDAAGDLPDSHVLIDPPNPSLSTTDPYYSAKVEVEKSKMSTQAGLYVQVDTTTLDGNGNPTIRMYGPAGSYDAYVAAGNAANLALKGPNGGLKLIPPANTIDGTVSGTGYVMNTGNAPSNSSAPPLIRYLPFRQLKVVTNGSGVKTLTVLKADGTTDTTMTTAVRAKTGTAIPPGAGNSTTDYTVYSDDSTDSQAVYSAKNMGYGMIDQRRASNGATTATDYSTGGIPANNVGATDLVQIDMKAMKAAVASMASGTLDATNSIKNPDGTLWHDSSGWNGGVYVDVKTAQTPSTIPYVSADYPSALSTQTTSVRLVNGQVTSGQSLIPSYGANGTGLTIATNTPVYIQGNFNADGTQSTGANGSAVTPDDGNSGAAGHASAESPVCIAADSVTILSNAWSDVKSVNVKTNATDTEVAAALLVGLQPTSNSYNSGGAHNLPRFLENWGNSTIRGSLVTMYSCKIATQPFTGAYYGAPNRNWGFDKIFQNGNYPPITPKVIDTRRIQFTSMNATVYAAALHTLWPTLY